MNIKPMCTHHGKQHVVTDTIALPTTVDLHDDCGNSTISKCVLSTDQNSALMTLDVNLDECRSTVFHQQSVHPRNRNLNNIIAFDRIGCHMIDGVQIRSKAKLRIRTRKPDTVNINR